MPQEQRTDRKRGTRRKNGKPAICILGHGINSDMTVITRWSAITTTFVCILPRRFHRGSVVFSWKENIMAIFKGAGVAIATPMNEDLSINYDRLAESIEDQIAGQTDAIIICGTTGESATMTEEEHMNAIKFTIDQVKGRIPVIAGTGSNCTETAVQLSREAAEAGADGLLLVTPYYNKATQNGLIAHYTRIANEAKIPSILYNVPSRTGCAIQPATVASLVKNVEYIVGIKEASGDISNVAQIMHLCDGAIDMYSGNDDQVVPLLSLGGIGVISVVSNIAPKYMHDMVMNYLDGNVAASCKMQLDCLPLVKALFCEVNPIPVKAALNLMGKQAGPLRAPLTEMEPAHQEVLKKAMQDMGIL